jgi:hypothetical protein
MGGAPAVVHTTARDTLQTGHTMRPSLSLRVQALSTFIGLLSGDELRVDHQLEPGDLQLLNNHCCIHTRTAFLDHEDPDSKRHLLRLWVAPPEAHAWPLPECFAEQYGTTAPGDRGGIRVAGFDACVPLEAE